MVIPSGRRISAPTPVAKASGSAPNIAASVVIRIGRKRSFAASIAASCTLKPRSRCACSAKSTSMMPFFLTMPISSKMPMKAITVNSAPIQLQRQQGADARRGQGRDDRDRMNVALVENAEDDVDREQRGQDDQPHAARRSCGNPRRRRRRRCAVRAAGSSRETASTIAAVPCSSDVPVARLKVIVIAGTTP